MSEKDDEERASIIPEQDAEEDPVTEKKKSHGASSLITASLMLSNISQLRLLLVGGAKKDQPEIWGALLALISISILLQLVIGILLIVAFTKINVSQVISEERQKAPAAHPKKFERAEKKRRIHLARLLGRLVNAVAIMAMILVVINLTISALIA